MLLGIGLATAKMFADEGALVAITGRSAEKLVAAKSAIGEHTIGKVVDMTSVAEIDAFANEVARAHGRIDIVVASAGGAEVRPFELMDEALFDMDLDRNFKGAYFAAQKALPHMSIGGAFVFLGSAAGSKGFSGMTVYGPSKAALRGLVRSLATELAPKGIRANVVSPGPIPTPGMDRLGLPPEQLEAVKQRFVSEVPLSRMGTVEDIANAITFLASDQAAYITGTELAVDGGHAQV
jgi:NAD(P)-dependent dehydrogenase (short-subunit alcohol dehydrogenase family)